MSALAVASVAQETDVGSEELVDPGPGDSGGTTTFYQQRRWEGLGHGSRAWFSSGGGGGDGEGGPAGDRPIEESRATQRSWRSPRASSNRLSIPGWLLMVVCLSLKQK